MEKYDFDRALEVLNNHGVIAFPTETVMGLGVFYDDKDAYNYLNSIKGRPEDKPYTMMLASVELIKDYAYVDEIADKLIKAFMPGPITLLLKAKSNIPSYVTHGTAIIGVRVPNHELSLEVLMRMGKPLLVPSANRSGERPAITSLEVKEIFGDEVGYVFEGEASRLAPSTIIDLTKSPYIIIREGPITKEMIEEVLK